jgi:L-rhamnose isomerase
MKDSRKIEEAYQWAKEEYGAIGVDTGAALAAMDRVQISLHCWQADDVGGFESPDAELATLPTPVPLS